MPSINRVILVGRAGRDPVKRFTKNGNPVASFSLAVEVGWGENKDTDWHEVAAWNKLADLVEQYIYKGALVLVEGSLRNQTWHDKEGNTREKTQIVASSAWNLSPLKNRDKSPDQDNYSGWEDDDEIPF